MKLKKIFIYFISLAMIVMLMPVTVHANGTQDTVDYIGEKGTTESCTNYTELKSTTSNDTTWNSGWYVVEGTFNIGSEAEAQRITVKKTIANLLFMEVFMCQKIVVFPYILNH